MLRLNDVSRLLADIISLLMNQRALPALLFRKVTRWF